MIIIIIDHNRLFPKQCSHLGVPMCHTKQIAGSRHFVWFRGLVYVFEGQTLIWTPGWGPDSHLIFVWFRVMTDLVPRTFIRFRGLRLLRAPGMKKVSKFFSNVAAMSLWILCARARTCHTAKKATKNASNKKLP